VIRAPLVGLGLALTAAACGGNTTPTPRTTQPLRGNGFNAEFSSAWTKTTRSLKGATEYELSSRGGLGNVGIPPAGAIGIVVQVLPYSVLEAGGAPNLASISQAQLVSGLVGTPKDATGVTASTGLHALALAGDRASGLSYTYTSGGTANVQEDVVDRHGTAVYFIELDTEPTLQSQGETALAAFLASWTWSS